MSGFNINDNPQGLGAISWLVYGLKTLWRRVNGIATGGGTSVTGVLLMRQVDCDLLSGDSYVILKPTDNFVITGGYVSVTAVTSLGGAVTSPVITIGWQGPSYNQILPSTTIGPTVHTQDYKSSIVPGGVNPVIPNGSDTYVKITHATGYSVFKANIYLLGYDQG